MMASLVNGTGYVRHPVPFRALLVCALGTALLLAEAPAARAGHEQQEGADPKADTRIEYDFDAPPKTRHHLTEHLTFGSQVEFDFEYERNYDLDKTEDDDVFILEPVLEVALSYDPTPWFQGFANFRFLDEIELDAPEDHTSRDSQLIVAKAFVNFREFADGLSLTLGRQDFEDEREWLYDEDLDGARLFFRRTSLGLEASVSRREIVGNDLLNHDRKERIDNYFLVGRYALGDDAEAGAYLLFRDDREERDDDPIFLGLRSSGALTSNLDYWIEAAHVRGSEGTVDIRGYGFDLGGTYVFDGPWQPSLTLGAAFGTGDRDRSDGTDHGFRQTGLQDNNDKFNGVTSFKYYGEVFDPELSNMAVLTGGVGIRPSRKSSLDLVYHYYRQHRADDELRDVDIDEDPEGLKRSLGHGLDLVFGFREFEDFDVEAIFGMFMPGAAFPDDADNAYFAGLEFEFNF